jgi:hypothetical protein
MKLEGPERLAKAGVISLQVIKVLAGAERDGPQAPRPPRLDLAMHAGLVRARLAFLSFVQRGQIW